MLRLLQLSPAFFNSLTSHPLRSVKLFDYNNSLFVISGDYFRDTLAQRTLFTVIFTLKRCITVSVNALSIFWLVQSVNIENPLDSRKQIYQVTLSFCPHSQTSHPWLQTL